MFIIYIIRDYIHHQRCSLYTSSEIIYIIRDVHYISLCTSSTSSSSSLHTSSSSLYAYHYIHHHHMHHYIHHQRCSLYSSLFGRYDSLDSVTDMLSSLKWRSLELRRSDARLCLLYKQSNGLATYESDKLQKEQKSRMGTRLSSLSHRLEQPRCTCDYYQNSFYPGTIAQWNNLLP